MLKLTETRIGLKFQSSALKLGEKSVMFSIINLIAKFQLIN